MRNINLLAKIPSLRNTIGPNTIRPRRLARKQKFFSRLLLSLFFALSTTYGLWLFDLYEPIKVIAIERVAMAWAELNPVEVEVKKEAVATKKVTIPSPPEKEEPVEARKIDKFRLTSITSRPVAEGALAVKGVGGTAAYWSVRFAVCVYKKNCNKVRKTLVQKGIKAYVDRGVAMIPTHQVIIGPWMTISSARLAQAALKKADVQSSFFTAGERSYLSTGPMTSLVLVEQTLAKVLALGYRAEKKSVREQKKIYKVYGGSYKSKQLAAATVKKYTAIGIKCVLEKRT